MEIKTFSPKNHKIKALVYGKSGVGKTTFAGSAENVLFASAENGLLSVANKSVAYTEIKSLENLIEVRDFLQKGEHNFETFVIDSITEISDIIKSEIEKKTGKIMQIQDWGELSNKIEKIIKDIKEINIKVLAWKNKIPKIFNEISEAQKEWEKDINDKTKPNFKPTNFKAFKRNALKIAELNLKQDELKKSISEELEKNDVYDFKLEGVLNIYQSERSTYEYPESIKELEAKFKAEKKAFENNNEPIKKTKSLNFKVL